MGMSNVGRSVVRRFELKRANCDLIMCEITKCGKILRRSNLSRCKGRLLGVQYHVLGLNLRRTVEDFRGRFGSFESFSNLT